MTTTGEPNIALEQFEGPLDLLLHLIRRQELDVSEIAVAQITDQYLGFLDRFAERSGTVDVDSAADFLVTAATLIELKSRVVGSDEEDRARSDRTSKEEEDPAGELIRSLLAYKQYRDAADELEARREVWELRHPSGKAAIDRQAIAEALADEATEEAELFDLVEAFRRIADTVLFDRLGDHEVVDEETPIELHREDLMDRLAREPGGRVTLARAFEGRSRSEMLGLFLALLELIRQRKVRVEVAGPGMTRPEDITLAQRDESEWEREDEVVD